MSELVFWIGLLAAMLAVLCLVLLVRVQRLEAEPRPTLRGYFIAHAPTEPQPWFRPVLPPVEMPLPRFTEMFQDVTDEERRALNHFDADYMSPAEVKEVRVRDYLVRQEEQRKRNRAHSALAERERFVQWPAAWADAMLNARAE